MKVLEVKALSKTFEVGEHVNPVLADVSFEVSEGEFIAVMGQSGSGKSTLLYNISGMDRMTEGDVLIEGISLSDQTDEELSELRLNQMGFVFQNNYLLKNLNIIDNICLPGFKSNKKTRDEVIKKAEGLMKDLDIESIKYSAINNVSGGQLQRAAVCRALINDPAILFADEPTGALNSRSSKEVLEIITDLNRKGTTVLTVTHDPQVACLTDRIIYLKDGRIDEQLTLGKYDDINTLKERHERTLTWLMKKGF